MLSLARGQVLKMTISVVSQDPLPHEGKDDLERFGITEVPAHYYEFGGYRYTNRRDAIAAAQRMGAKP